MNQAMLSPSMMCAPLWQDVTQTLHQMKELQIEWLHADVMDGHFVPNLMLGTDAVKQLRKLSPIPLDVHLMVEHPENILPWFDPQPGEFFSVHAESTAHLQRVLSLIRSFGAKPMVALNPATPLCMIEDVIDDVDGILIMTVNPGFAGQKLVPQTLDKIRRTRSWLHDLGKDHILIEVDGNVSFENAVKMRAAGADIFVCGTSSLFSKEGSLTENALRMRQCIR